MRSDLVFDLAEWIDQVPVDTARFIGRGNALKANGAGGIVLVAKREVIGRDGDGQPFLLRPRRTFPLFRCQLERLGELLDRANRRADLGAPIVGANLDRGIVGAGANERARIEERAHFSASGLTMPKPPALGERPRF